MTTSVKHIENIKSLLVSRPAADGVLLTIIQAMKVFANFDMQSMKGSQVVSSYSSTMKIVPVPQEDDDNLEVNVVQEPTSHHHRLVHQLPEEVSGNEGSTINAVPLASQLFAS